MNRTREEELRQLQNLHLLPDERDNEIETAGRSRAASVMLTLSLLFSAACLLQGSSTWTAFLSLALAGGAGQCFHQFSCQHERFYVLFALVLTIPAVLLGGSFLLSIQGEGLFSLGRLVAFAVLACLLTSLAGIAALLLFLLWAWCKGRCYHKDSARWEAYFQSVSTLGLLVRMGVLISAAMALTAALSCPLFSLLGFPAPERLALVFLIGGWVYLFQKFHRHRKKLLLKLLRLKSSSNE